MTINSNGTERTEMTYEAWRISYQSSEQAARAAYMECVRLQVKINTMEKRLRLILEEPENTLSNSKALREVIRQAKLALEESK